MNKKFSIVKIALLSDIFLGIVLAAWSRWRWNKCGYDCGLFGVDNGPTSIVGWYVGVAIAALSIVALLFIHERSR